MERFHEVPKIALPGNATAQLINKIGRLCDEALDATQMYFPSGYFNSIRCVVACVNKEFFSDFRPVSIHFRDSRVRVAFASANWSQHFGGPSGIV